jgi:hypothetical protein
LVERVGYGEVDAVRDRQRTCRRQALDSAEDLRRVGHAADRGADGRVPGAPAREADFFSYGLGWFIQDYRGQQVWMHTGSINGLCAIIGIEPNKRLGVYVLENLDHAELRHGLMYSVFDLFENGPRRDWSATSSRSLRRARGQPPAAAAARATSAPSLRSSATPGRTSTRPMARCASQLQDGGLQAAVVTDPAVPLEPVSFEAFRTKPSEGARPTVLTFIPDGSGGVSGVRCLNILFARVLTAVNLSVIPSAARNPHHPGLSRAKRGIETALHRDDENPSADASG